ncbi:hypothetical protein ACTL6U_05700 [Rhodovibrionaceae bacterium A322]
MSHLGNHPHVTVPMFEGLDRYVVAKSYDPGAVEPLLPKIVGKVFRTGDYDVETLLEGLEADDASEDLSGSAVGFKWRIWGNVEELAEVFLQQDVKLLNIQRHSFSNLIFSHYITSVETKKFPDFATFAPSHFQFLMAQSNKKEQKELSSALNGIRFDIVPELLWPIAERFLRNYRRRHSMLSAFSAAGVPMHNIYHEDFVDDTEASLRQTLRFLDLEYHPDVLTTTFTKVLKNDPLKMAQNTAEILELPEYVDQEAQWNDIRRSIQQMIDQPGRQDG